MLYHIYQYKLNFMPILLYLIYKYSADNFYEQLKISRNVNIIKLY